MHYKKNIDRRTFIKTTTLGGASVALSAGLPGKSLAADAQGGDGSKKIPVRVLGKTGISIPILGLGGIDWSTFDGTASCREYPPRILFFGPPENLVHPVDPPIAQCAVAIVEKLAESFRVYLGVKWSQGTGPAPHIPIKTLVRFFILFWCLRSSSVMHKGTYHTDLAGLAFLEKFHTGNIVR